MRKVPGKITISRVNDSHGDDYVEIDIQDRLSGQHIVGAKMTMADFAHCVTGMGHMDTQISMPEPKHLDRVGKKRETQTVKMIVPQGISRHGKLYAETLLGMIRDDIAANFPEWELWGDGIGSQQRLPDHHVYIICKYTEETES